MSAYLLPKKLPARHEILTSKIQPLLVNLLTRMHEPRGTGTPATPTTVQIIINVKEGNLNDLCHFLDEINAEIVRKNPFTVEARLLADKVEPIAALEYVESIRLARLFAAL